MWGAEVRVFLYCHLEPCPLPRLEFTVLHVTHNQLFFFPRRIVPKGVSWAWQWLSEAITFFPQPLPWRDKRDIKTKISRSCSQGFMICLLKQKWTSSEKEEFQELWGILWERPIVTSKSGQGKFRERLNLPDCAGLGVDTKEGKTEGDIPGNRQGRLSQRQHMHKLRPFQKMRSKESKK